MVLWWTCNQRYSAVRTRAICKHGKTALQTIVIIEAYANIFLVQWFLQFRYFHFQLELAKSAICLGTATGSLWSYSKFTVRNIWGLLRRQCAQYHTYSQGQIFILGGKTAVMNATDDDSWIIYPADFASVLGKCLLSIIVTNLLGMFQLIKTSL